MQSSISMLHRPLTPFTCHIVQRLLSAQKLATSSASTIAKQTPSKNERLVKVAIVGVPNAGKSTFINNLINHRICPTSSKVHTTRGTAKAIHVRNNAQLILFDTPGLVGETEMRKHHLESSFVSSQRHSIQHADLIGIVHDVSNTWARGELHSTVLNTLAAYPKVPSILILNKIDTLKSKRVLLDLARSLTLNTLAGKVGTEVQSSAVQRRQRRGAQTSDGGTNPAEAAAAKRPVGWAGFSEVFMISSMTGDGMAMVMKYLLAQAKSAAWEYTADEFTDQPPEELVVQSVRARLLDFLPQEIPYQLRSEIEFYTKENGRIFTSVQVTCPSERIERLVCGEKDGKLRQITERVTSDLIETFGIPISLTITTRTTTKSAQ